MAVFADSGNELIYCEWLISLLGKLKSASTGQSVISSARNRLISALLDSSYLVSSKSPLSRIDVSDAMGVFVTTSEVELSLNWIKLHCDQLLTIWKKDKTEALRADDSIAAVCMGNTRTIDDEELVASQNTRWCPIRDSLPDPPAAFCPVSFFPWSAKLPGVFWSPALRNPCDWFTRRLHPLLSYASQKFRHRAQRKRFFQACRFRFWSRNLARILVETMVWIMEVWFAVFRVHFHTSHNYVSLIFAPGGYIFLVQKLTYLNALPAETLLFLVSIAFLSLWGPVFLPSYQLT